jgi:hypothetical protein
MGRDRGGFKRQKKETASLGEATRFLPKTTGREQAAKWAI